MRSLPLVLALAACAGDKGILIYNESPAAGIIEPADGTVFDEGTPIYITGAVQDDAAVEALQIEWLSSIDGVLPDADAPDVDGFVEYSSASFSEGVHIVTLRATDEQGAQGEATVEFEVVDVPDLPSIEVVAPTADDRGLEDFPFIFWVRVSDAADLPEQLTVSLVANPGGFVCEMVPSGSGEAQCAGTLPIGSYVLTFTVMDTEGFTADAVATYIVVSALDYDADGDGVSINGGDCNDSNVTVYPGAPELCDGLDNDCNELTGIDVGSECYDDDGDGYCEVPPCVNTKSSVSDCDDASAVSYPGGTEVANHHDDDCDGTVDEGTEFYDDDGDGYCEAPPCENAAGAESDGDDADYDHSPGTREVCGDGVDQNCNGVFNEKNATGCNTFFYDGDGDGFGVSGASECWCDAGTYPYTGVDTTDCYDANAAANPAQTGYFAFDRGDGSYDFNCNGSAEKSLRGVTGGCGWDVVDITCEVNGAGWDVAEPACGASGQWVGDCDATYDYLCYLGCLFTPDPIGCLIGSCSATCDPEYAPTTQTCR
jgi:hypothetical protein